MSVIVTGSARGIGLAITKDVSHVVAVARSDNDALKALASKYGQKLVLVLGDVTDKTTNTKAVKEATARGALLGIIANAGVSQPMLPLHEFSDHLEEVSKLFQVNILAPFDLVSQAIPHLRASGASGFGRVVIISSGASSSAYPGLAAYGASKAAMNCLAQSIKNEEPSIIPIALRPGVVQTDMVQGIIDDGTKSGVDVQKFQQAQKNAVQPATIGGLVSRLILSAPNDLRGAYISYDDERLKPYLG